MAEDRLGFIGLGTMGMPMSLNILGAGKALTVWGRNREKLKDALDAGATWAQSPKDMAEACDVIFLCVFDTAAVEEVVFGSGGIAEGAGSNTLVVDHSSIHPDGTRDIAARLLEKTGAHWIDCPVSGGRYGARDGTLVMMAGGDKPDVTRIRPHVEPTSQRLTHMGPVGCGQATKLVNQAVIGAEVAVLSEMFGFANKYGVDVKQIPDALAGGWADSTVLQDHARRMIRAEYWSTAPGNTVKDLNTVCEMGKKTSSPMPMAALTTELYRFLEAQGHAEKGQIGLMYLYVQENLEEK